MNFTYCKTKKKTIQNPPDIEALTYQNLSGDMVAAGPPDDHQSDRSIDLTESDEGSGYLPTSYLVSLPKFKVVLFMVCFFFNILSRDIICSPKLRRLELF